MSQRMRPLWECPKCGRVNAPTVKQCPCTGPNYLGSRPERVDYLG